MSRHDVAVLTLRAFALYAWFQALEFFASGAMTVILTSSLQIQRGLTMGSALSLFSPAAFFIVIGVLLFVCSRELASWLLPPPDNVVLEQLPPAPLPVATVAFAAVGVAIFLYAAPRVISDGITFADISEPNARVERFRADAPHVLADGTQLVLGFLLVLKSRAFATAWWRKQQPKAGE